MQLIRRVLYKTRRTRKNCTLIRSLSPLDVSTTNFVTVAALRYNPANWKGGGELKPRVKRKEQDYN